MKPQLQACSFIHTIRFTVFCNVYEWIHKIKGTAHKTVTLTVRVNKTLIAMNKPLIAMNKPLIAMNKPLIAMNKPLIATNKPLIAMNKPLIAMNKLLIAMEDEMFSYIFQTVAMDSSRIQVPVNA